jgi:hypothetical protein
VKRSLTRKSIVVSAGGMLAAGLLATAAAATAANAATVKDAAPAARGPAWHTILSAANGRTPHQIDTVVATGKTTGWAFLNAATVAYERTGATTWKKVAFPSTGGWVNVAGSSSPSNVWAALRSSSGQATELYRWNGRSWRAAKSLRGSLTAISVLGPNDVWVFGGSAGVTHFNGRTWTKVSSTLQGGSALSDNNVWAFNGTDVDHYNGRKWTATNVASLLPAQLPGHGPSALTNILALAPNNVYATGEGDQTPRGGPGVVLHFNGHTWTRAAESGSFATISGESLTSDGKGGFWISSESFPSRLEGALFHYAAGQLTEVNLGAFAYSVSHIPGTAEALAGGFQAGTGTGSAVVWQYS